ncbi:MAG: thiamine phosphate synthase [Burkholderiales bacterium]
MRPKPLLRGLYAVTPDTTDTATLLRHCSEALGGGARIIQYRNKTAGPDLARMQAQALLTMTRRSSAALIVNDSLALACEIDADGVHLGADDGDLTGARQTLGPDKWLGASCYNRLETAIDAQAAGADYVAFGAVFTSGTKPSAVRASRALFTEARAALRVPICAIGGLSVENSGLVIAAGADMVAVVSALFYAPDIRAAAASFTALFAGTRT